MLNSLLSMTCEMLEVACTRAPKEAHAEGAFAGPLWQVPIPGTKDIIPFVLDFARAGQVVKFSANDRPFVTLKLAGQPVIEETAVSIPYSRKLFSGAVQPCSAAIPYTCHAKARSLCRGQWTTFGVGKVQLRSLIPNVTWKDGAAVIEWPSSPAVSVKEPGPLGLLDWVVNTKVKQIIIGEFKGRVVFDRWVKTFLAPDMGWA